jgi:flagellar protein FliS
MTSAHQTVYKAYSRANHTVAKTRQVVMLYDGAIRFLKQAREDMVERRIESRFNKLMRVGEIIMGLQSSLDFDNGGDTAKVLYAFYSNIDMRVLSLHRSNDVEECDRIILELKEMRDVWDKIDRGETAETTESSTTQDTPPAPPQDSVTFSV